MANTHKTTAWLVGEPLVILKARSSFAPGFNTEYNKEFNKEYPIGQFFDIPYPYRFTTRTGQNIAVQDVTKRVTRVNMSDPTGIDFAWNDFEAALEMEHDEATLRRRFTEPAGAALATALDMQLAEQAYLRCPNIVGVLGTDPTSVNTYSTSQRRMTEVGAPEGDQRAWITPSMADTLRVNLTTLQNPAGDISDMFREGKVGPMYGAKFFETVKLRQHTTGIVTSAAALTLNATPAQGATSVVINCTAADTFKRGERVCFAASFWVHPDTRQRFGTALANQAVYIVQQDVTASTTTCTLTLDRPIYGPGSVYQNCDALPLVNALMTRWPGTTIADAGSVTGTVGLRMHKTACALVGAKLRNPKGSVEVAEQRRDPDTGLALSLVSQWDIDSRITKTRFEYWPGFGTLYGAEAAVCILGA